METKNFVFLRALLGACLMGLFGPGVALADTFPDRPIKLVVPFTAGGAADGLARIVGEGMAKRLGQPIIVDNKGGANGIIATSSVTSAKADGYTLLLCTSGTALNQTLYKTPYDALTDLTPITNLITVPMLLVVNPSLPVKSVAEFLDYAKKNPNGMSYSSWGVGSSAHLAGEMLRLSVGVPMVHVPFKGSAGALSEVLAGRIPFAFTTIPLGLQHIKAGKLRLLGVTADAPVPQLPGVPLLKNSGLPELVVEGWNGLCAPGGLPNDVVQKLYKAVDATLKEPAVRERLTDEGYVIIGNRPSEFSRAFKAEVPKWAELVKKANIKVN